MTSLRQKLVPIAALALGVLFAPIRIATLLSHSAPIGPSLPALHYSSPAAGLTQSEAAVSGMCRNDPVNSFDQRGLMASPLPALRCSPRPDILSLSAKTSDSLIG